MELTESGASRRGATPYCFDDIVVDPAARRLLRAGVPQPVEPKTFAVLMALLQRPGELIDRDELLDVAWGHRHVTPGVLTRAVAQLRQALGDDAQHPRYILTRHALGYSFIGQLKVPADGEEASATAGDAVADVDPPAPPTAEAAHPFRHAQDAPASAWATAEAGPASTRRTGPLRRYGTWLVLALVLGGTLAWMGFRRPADPPRVAASVAVMPFTSLGGDHANDYFAEGLTEEMRDALAGVKGLKVAASVSPAASAGAADARALGARLGVATLLNASVRREGSRLRITARLTDTSTGFTLWSHTYDRELAGVFETQTAIAGEVVRALLGTTAEDGGVLARRLAPTRNEAAFDTYLQGLHLLRQTSQPGAAERAAAHFGRAVEQDSGFVLAQVALCRAEILRFRNKHSPAAFDNARLACGRAARMDPQLAEVKLAQGDLHAAANDHKSAFEYYRSSLQQAGSIQVPVAAHVGMAQLYAEEGKRALAVQEFREALKLSPDNALVHANIGYQQYLDGQSAQAVASYRRALALAPDNPDLWDTLGGIYMAAGNDADAAVALEHAITLRPTAANLTDLGLLRFRAGDYAAAVNLQRQAIAVDPQDFMTWGNLGDALRALPGNHAVEMRQAFSEAASRAERYLKTMPEDAQALAALAFYRVMLGDPHSARSLLARAEALPDPSGEVALLDAETLALLGDLDSARQRLALARERGVHDGEINSNLTFRRLGLLSGAAGKPAGTESPVPHQGTGHPTEGE